MEQIKIKVHSKVEQSGEEEVYDSFADATLQERGNLLTINYEELIGKGQRVYNKLILHKNPARAVLKRSGAVKAVFVFDEAIRTDCLYHTDEMSLALDIQTDRVCLEEQNGRLVRLMLDYQLHSGTTHISNHTLRIDLEYPKTKL